MEGFLPQRCQADLRLHLDLGVVDSKDPGGRHEGQRANAQDRHGRAGVLLSGNLFLGPGQVCILHAIVTHSCSPTDQHRTTQKYSSLEHSAFGGWESMLNELQESGA